MKPRKPSPSATNIQIVPYLPALDFQARLPMMKIMYRMRAVSSTLSEIASNSATVRPKMVGGVCMPCYRPILSAAAPGLGVGGDAHAQRVEADEAVGVALVVGAGIVLEGGDGRVEQ